MKKNTLYIILVMLLASVTSWAQDVIEIGSVADLKAFRDAVNSGNQYTGKTVKLTSDLDLSSEANWKPIGNLVAYPGQSFNGTFDGQDHTISNLTVVDNTPNYAVAGLFGSVVDGTIKNLTVSNVNIQSTHYAGGIVAYTSNAPTIENCHVKGGTITSKPEVVGGSYDNGDKVGGIMGYATAGSTIKGCTVKDVTLTAYRDLGGVAGFSAGTVQDCNVADVKLVQSLANGYKSPTPTTVAAIIGRESSPTTSNNTESGITTSTVDPVAKIGTEEFITLQSAIDAAEAGATIEIQKDFTLTTVTTDPSDKFNVNINKSLTINGKGYTITSSTGKRALLLTGTDNTITLKNLTVKNNKADWTVGISNKLTANLDNVTLDGTGRKGGYNQVLTITGDEDGAEVNITNGSVIKTNDDGKAHYAIIVWKKATINVENSSLIGWANVYLKPAAAGSVVNIKNSNMTSTGLTGTSNNFAMIVSEGDGNDITLENNTIKNHAQDGTYESLLLLSGKNNTVKIIGGSYSTNNPTYGGLTYNWGSFTEEMGNDVYFDAVAKNIFSTYVDGTKGQSISDATETVGGQQLYPLGYEPDVFYYWDTTTGQEGTYCSLADPFTNGWLADKEYIKLKKDLTLTGDITITLTDGQSFSLLFDGHTLTAGDYSIKMPAGVSIITDKKVTDGLFTAADPSTYAIFETVNTDGTYTYTAKEGIVKNVTQNIVYATLQQAVNGVQAVETIVILNEIAQADPTTISKGGFTIDGQGHSLSCNYVDDSGIHSENTVTDPEKEYRNGKGALFFNADAASLVTINNLNIKGFAYAIDVDADDVAVTMNGGKTYGRAALNVHGDNGNFIFKDVEVHGLNNQSIEGTEQFAAFVLDSDANDNTLTIEDCKVLASVKEGAGYNTEKFIELRGANNKVLVKGTTAYTCDPEEGAGFTNKSSDVANDKVYFDPAAKQQFQALFDKDTELEISDIETADKYTDLDVEGTYPLIASVPVVIVDEEYMFATIEKAFASDKFDANSSSIKLLGDVTLAGDFTPAMDNGDMFTINANGKKLNGGGHHINLKPGAIVEVRGITAADAVEAIFASTDDKLVIIATEVMEDTDADGTDELVGFDFTAGNCLVDGVANLLNNDSFYADAELTLVTDVELSGDVDLSTMTYDDVSNPATAEVPVFADGSSFKLNFTGKTLSGGKILMPAGVSVTTDQQTTLLTKAATVPTGYEVMETANADGTFTYTVTNALVNAVVRNENTGLHYSTLQTAVAIANEGDKLSILKNITTDKQVDITKPLTIQSESGAYYTISSGAAEYTYLNMRPLFNLTGLAEGAEVTFQDFHIDGFAYAVNVENNVKGVTVNLKSTNGIRSITGRAAINNWGSNNTFNVEGFNVFAINNEKEHTTTDPDEAHDYEYFAAFVDNKSYPEDANQFEAKNNTYNIKDVTVSASVSSDASPAATSKFIDLRGSGAKVNLRNVRYNYNGDLDYRFGFTNPAYDGLLVSSNQVWFDTDSKLNFATLVNAHDGLSISETQDADHDNLYPLVRTSGGVRLVPNAGMPYVSYFFDTLQEAIKSDKFQKDALIELLGDQNIDEDITLPFAAMEGFVINLKDGETTHTINFAEGKGIVLQPLVTVDVQGATDATDAIFKLADEKTVLCADAYSTLASNGKLYTAANIKYIPEGDVTGAQYYMFDDLLTDGLNDNDIIDLKTNIVLSGNKSLPVEATKDVDIHFGEYDITGGSLKLVDGAAVNTDRQTLVFVPETAGSFIKESINDDGTFRYEVMTAEPGDAVARIDNRYFTTLQAAANVAKDGETIVVLKNIETAETVDIKTAVTINGQGFQVKNTKEAHDAVAFNITAKGDVTFNKLNIYNPNGDAIEVNDGYNGQLTINNSKINSSRRAIDVRSVAEGFGLTVNGSEMTVIFKQKDDDGLDTYAVDGTKDPKKEYVNMISAGVYFANDAVAADVLIDKSLIQGFSYGVNVSNNSGKLNVTLSDGAFYGRAVVNNWGDGSTFNLDNMAVNGLNNEPAPVTTGQNDYEYFATIVDNVAAEGTDQTGKAEHNTYNINNSTFTANADEAGAPAATEKFIDLRGDNAQVKITGNTTYTYAGDAANAESKGGFTNPEFFLNLYNNNKVWFDEAAKAVFRPLVETYVDADGNNVTIVDELDPVVNLYPLGQFNAAVVMHTFDDAGNETKYYFADLDKALTSPQFGADVQIDLLKNQDLEHKEYTIDVPFTLNLNYREQTGGLDTPDVSDDVFTTRTATVSNGKFNLVPANSVTVIGGSTATDALFQVAEGYEDYAAIIKDGEDNPVYYAANAFSDGIGTYTYFDYLFDESRDETLTDEGYVRAETDFKLDQSLKVPSDVKKFYIDYNNGKKIDRDDYSIVLKPDQVVYTNADAEDLFSSADPEYTVMVDAVSVTKELINDKGTPETDDDVVLGTYSFTKKYYLIKDGLAVTVSPATYCGHEQKPTVIVKKKVTDDAGNETWNVLTPNTDYTWQLVPNEAADAYIAARTYANSVVIDGKTFQGRRKADFIINPRNINDVTVKGNDQPYRADGYTAAQIAALISAEYGCIVNAHKVDATTVMTYTLKKKGSTTETPDYLVTVTLPEGTTALTEIGTYKDIITLQALEGNTGENAGTQNFVGTRKVDFTINSGDGIDIANVVVTSKAVYTSQAQAPSYDNIEVVYNNGTEKVVLDPEQFTIDVHGMPTTTYIDAQTYSNAMTLKGTMKYKPGSTNTLKFYGTVNVDYVIAPRDLADNEMGTDKGFVSLTKVADMDWTGNALTPNINADADNNIALTMTYEATPTNGTYKLMANDYSYTVEPSPMQDPGLYKVIFTGRGNFTGMNEVNIAVLKDINAAEADVALQVIPGVNETNYGDGTGLKPSQLEGVNVTDGTTALTNDEHYTVTVKGQSGTDYTEANPIKNQGIYTATITGKYPYYKGSKKVDFPAVFEYYTYEATNVASEHKFGIHVTSGIDQTATVGALSGLPVPATQEGLIIDPAKVVTVGASTAEQKAVTLTVNGIDDNAFNSTNRLRYVDASALDGYTPSSLSRTGDGPFNGINKQAIVYLDGDDVIGENYVYETSAGDFRADEFKIYDDVDGDQKGFDNEGQGSHTWEIKNIHEFTAKTLTNTRYFIAGQHYTTLLPYALPLGDGLKAYTLNASSDKLFGFREIEESELTQFTPYVLIPSESGNLLSTTDAVVYVTATSNRGFYPLSNGNRQTTEIATPAGHVLYGSMIYMGLSSSTPIVKGTYIMQSGNQWKKIGENATYDGACILPMRAYILKLNDGIDGHGREMMTAQYIDLSEKMALDAEGDDDWTGAEVYDLQGRKVDTTQQMRKGVYIVNGKKRIRK